jgi:hypothetical protein
LKIFERTRENIQKPTNRASFKNAYQFALLEVKPGFLHSIVRCKKAVLNVPYNFREWKKGRGLLKD